MASTRNLIMSSDSKPTNGSPIDASAVDGQQRDPTIEGEARAYAALSASQALLLALLESGAVDREHVIESLGDAISYHKGALDDSDRIIHTRAVGLIEDLIADCEAAETPGNEPGKKSD